MSEQINNQILAGVGRYPEGEGWLADLVDFSAEYFGWPVLNTVKTVEVSYARPLTLSQVADIKSSLPASFNHEQPVSSRGVTFLGDRTGGKLIIKLASDPLLLEERARALQALRPFGVRQLGRFYDLYVRLGTVNVSPGMKVDLRHKFSDRVPSDLMLRKGVVATKNVAQSNGH